MRLYLVRHGPACVRDPSRWPNDSNRPLSPDGSRKTRAAARAFAREVGSVDWVATSPARRAVRTAEIWASELDPSPKVVPWPELAMEQPARAALDRVARESLHAEHAAVVGHAPGLAELLGLALTGEAVPIAHLSKAGTAAIEFPRRVGPGAGRLEWLVTRKQWIR